MNIIDIAIAKQLAGGGGGSGTDSYNDLSNLPKINDVTLSGNKSSSALGLQSEITSDSKLASDLVDDTNQDNKFVTSTEKNTWNGKQNAIDSDHKLSSDLVDDANKTNKFVTTTEKNTWNAKQNAIDSDHKLSSSLVSFTDAEAAAIASGIDSSKVGQISTNQTNILLVQDATKELVDKGAKNIFDITTPDLLRDTVVTPLSNGGATLSCNNAAWTQYGKNIDVEVGKKYKVIVYIDSITGSVGTDFNVNLSQGGIFLPITPTNTGEYSVEVESTATTLGVAIFINNSGTPKSLSINMRMMICTLDEWKVSQQYIPYALPNYDLTRLEAEDRASLAEVVDSGAKNLLPRLINSGSHIEDNVTFTVNSDGSITVNSTGAISDSVFINYYNGKMSDIIRSAGVYKLFASDGTGNAQVKVWWAYTDTWIVVSETSNSTNTTYISESDLNRPITIRIVVFTGNAISNAKVYPMICSEADWKVSQKYAPYRKNLDQLEATKAPALDTGAGVDSGSLDDISENTFAIYTTNVSNLPTATSYYYVETSVFNSSSALQRAYDTGNGESYVRVKYQGTWQAWKQITNA